jgi:aconitase A
VAELDHHVRSCITSAGDDDPVGGIWAKSQHAALVASSILSVNRNFRRPPLVKQVLSELA